MSFYQPATHEARSQLAGPKITSRFARLFVYIYLCVCTYHVRNNYVTYIVAMRPYFSRLCDSALRRLLCVAAMSSYDFEMDTEKQRQSRRDDARLTESGNARSEQLLLVVTTESLTNRVWLA